MGGQISIGALEEEILGVSEDEVVKKSLAVAKAAGSPVTEADVRLTVRGLLSAGLSIDKINKQLDETLTKQGLVKASPATVKPAPGSFLRNVHYGLPVWGWASIAGLAAAVLYLLTRSKR